jgi:hypothetical protein
MKKMFVAVALAVAAFLALASPALAQKGKGQGQGKGKGGGVMPNPGKVLPSGPAKVTPAWPVERPNAGNSLPQSTLDKLPPGLRDKPENHPGLMNHLRKLAESQPPTNLLNPSGQLLTPNQQLNPLFAPRSWGNTLPQDILNRLQPGLRDLLADQPALANYLRQLLPLQTMTPSAPAPVPAQPFRPLGGFFRR